MISNLVVSFTETVGMVVDMAIDIAVGRTVDVAFIAFGSLTEAVGLAVSMTVGIVDMAIVVT